MAKLDLSKLSLAELQEAIKEATELAEMKRGDEVKTLVNGWWMKADKLKITVAELIAELKTYDTGKAAAAPKGAAKKVLSMDNNGKMPEPGKTYVDPVGGTEYVKKAGRVPQVFVDALTAGKTWESMLKKKS
jgi:hypothetical protein